MYPLSIKCTIYIQYLKYVNLINTIVIHCPALIQFLDMRGWGEILDICNSLIYVA